MAILKNLSVRMKLLLLVSLPIAGLLYFSFLNLNRASQITDTAEHIEQLVKIAAINGALVHELQKERGASAGYLSSTGREFGEILSRQRQASNKALNARQQLIDEIKSSIEDPEIHQNISEVSARLENLNQIRKRVKNMNIPMPEAIGFYTKTNSLLLDIAPMAADISNDAEISQMIQAYYNFLQGKERAGIERAVLSSAFSMDKFIPGAFTKFITLVSQQDTYLSTFQSFAQPEQIQFFREAIQDDSFNTVKGYRNKAIDRAEFGSFGADATDWFQAATGRINQLKRVEDRLSDNILQFSARQRDNASNESSFLIALSILFIVMTFAAGYWMVTLITKQVTSLTNTVAVSAQQKNLTVRADIYSKDELGKTACSLNDMFATFSSALDEIGKASIQLANAAEETSATVNESGANLEEQQMQTDMVVTATEQMSATTQEVARSIHTAAEAATRTRSTAEEGAKAVRQNVERIRNLANEVQEVGNIIEELHADSANIVKVIEVIKSVAEQTNLLALNAAIEAARAGEQGRGFAVVADEVRTLAKRTQSSTSEIESIISNFNAMSERAFETIKASSEMAVDTAAQTGGLEEALENISMEVSAISDMATQVATAAEEQVATTAEISRNMETISSMTQSTASGATQISAVAQEQPVWPTSYRVFPQSLKLRGQYHSVPTSNSASPHVGARD